MSEWNNETDVANHETRPNKMTGIDAGLRDISPQSLVEKLEELGVGEKLAKLWLIGNANRTTWLERQQIYLQDWDEFLVSTAEGPFSGSSNLHLPMPLVIAKTIHARFMQALLGVDPPFLIKGRTEGEIERAGLVTSFLKYILLEYSNFGKGIEPVIDKWIWDWVTAGCSILKLRWDCTYERFIDVKKVKIPGPPTYKIDEKTQKQVMERTTIEKEVDFHNTVKVYEGPVFDFRNMEDLLITGGEGDIDRADSVIDRYFLTASDLWMLADRKVFDEENVRFVVKEGRDHTMGAINSAIKLQRVHDAGKATIRSAAELDRFEILESYVKWDVDGSGINSEIVVWVAFRSRKILRATYLRRLIDSGERPFAKIDFHLRPDSEYGIGIIEIIHPLTNELDALHNLRIDMGLIATMPFFFYRPTSNLQPEVLELTPGSGIPLDNPQTDVYFPNLGNRTAWGFQEEAALINMIERVTSINEIQQGVLSGAQGPTRTATGASALMNESSANLDVFLRRLNRGWKHLLKMTFHMLRQRIEPGFQFRVTGDDGQEFWSKIQDQNFLQGDYDFQIMPNSSQSNPQMLQNMADTIVQMTQNPLDIQLGIITPSQRFEALKNWFRVRGIVDWAKYINKPQNYQAYMPTPQEEANRVLRQIDVPVTPQMDHQGFVDYVNFLFKNKEQMAQFDEKAVLLLKQQAEKHRQMLDALNQMKNQQNNLSQMQMNASQGFGGVRPGGQSGAPGVVSPGQGGSPSPQAAVPTPGMPGTPAPASGGVPV